MKFKALLAVFCVACLGVSAFADAGDALITFSTKAPSGDYKGDVYADGSVVCDGEWYALCWSAGEFGGFTSTCAPAVAEDKVLLLAPLAKGGHCPFVVFQVARNQLPSGGNFSVRMLDTRDVSGKPAAANAAGLPVLVNGAVATTAAVNPAAQSVSSATSAELAAGGAAAWSESAVAENVAAPKIKSFRVSGDKAFITVSGMAPSVRYNVKCGATPTALTETALELPISSEKNDVEFVVDAKASQFFQVVRQSLK